MYTYKSRHYPLKKHLDRHFILIGAISVVAVFMIALLSRAELRLAGELVAAGDEQDLVTLTKMGSYDSVELVRETDSLKLYILHSKKNDFLVEVILEDGVWVVGAVEKLH